MMLWKKFKRFVYEMLVPAIRLGNYLGFKWYLANTEEIWLVVGAGGTKFKGWFSTDKSVLDITRRSDFQKYFKTKKISRILAEHVLEHLTDADLHAMAKNFAEFSTDEVNIRVAVPDGNHADREYIECVKPGGSGAGADDHKHLYTYQSLAAYFTPCGFTATNVEYWDDDKQFHTSYTNDEYGFIERSLLNDDRNADGKPHYTSLIVDFRKSK